MHSTQHQHLSAASTDEPKPIVWSIAASDSGGGAGIQADTLTIHDLGGHPCNVVTAITAQNSIHISQLTTSDAAVLTAQLNCLAADMPPKGIKIGVLTSAQQVRLLSHWLQTNLDALAAKLGQSIPVIWDPVMLASNGHMLTESTAAPSTSDYLALAKQVSLITPNYSEFCRLTETNHSENMHDDWQQQLQKFVQKTGTNVLLTGGDQASQQAVDWLYTEQIEHTSAKHLQQLIGFSSHRIATQHNHGTGCTYSSGIASAMALGYPLLDAICIAKAYVNQGLTAGYAVGQGPGVLSRNGWPQRLSDFPTIILPAQQSLLLNEKLRFTKVQTPLQVYPVTQSVGVLEQVLAAGALTVQLRIKGSIEPVELEQNIKQAIDLGRQYQAQVFINDHWQLAIKHHAFGVHLGQEDMLEADLKQIADAGLALGLSSHGYFEILLAAQRNPSYLAIGHVFPTPTKSMPSQPQGLSKLSRYGQLLQGKLPLVAIGGINAENMATIKQSKIDDIAVVRAIEEAVNPGLSWQNLQHHWQQNQ
ncbi:bifunctional hydroxymethylpyrimidine kinase/phosphomethylpyrimidine kinase [Paraglaciecola aquimarina]|uniref:Thiamine-phosphate synthase n=1 Tax=Paraglaciecola aquimarina TaxID=1235557 RepID=A0ABU3SSD2_9ALTE|nr:bifunctional hydroxymethylpyrimidine kinase/phosphomethylpyrimidine kinase [Paraglaciecola aquimarina]MDU0352928.1 bifunctional hydroxymethylpyrimidine kinase/phosphomethylpyrimidine kinase [Paraglaciecola aquimarina]